MKTYPTGIKKPENMFICHLVGSMADKCNSASPLITNAPHPTAPPAAAG